MRGKPVHLTPKEFDLLRELSQHSGTPISHRRLLQAVWGPDYGEETELLRVVVNQLRRKIEADPAKPKYIVTEPWVGYRFVLPEDASAAEPDEESQTRRCRSCTQRRNATSVHNASTAPNGHAPCRNPYVEPSAQAAAKPSTNQWLRRSSA